MRIYERRVRQTQIDWNHKPGGGSVTVRADDVPTVLLLQCRMAGSFALSSKQIAPVT